MKIKPFDEFISYWREFDFKGPSYVHPQDRDWLLHKKRAGKVTSTAPLTPREWVDEGRGEKIQLGLLPAPYSGDLQNADIIICLLNPGLSPADFYAEQQKNFRDALIKTITQEAIDVEQYPFLCLDPQWCWTGGYQWWAKKLDGVIAEAARASKCDWADASKALSKRIAVVELFPYHSRSFSLGPALSKLPSCIAAMRFVHAVANDPKKTVIVTRQIRGWNIPVPVDPNENLVLYGNGQQRGAHLTPTSDGGKAILKRLLRVIDSPIVIDGNPVLKS